jgi:hypothetical protein
LTAVRPIFVVGSPRSGTTMIGNYLGSARSVLNAGEYQALYLAYGTLPYQLNGQLTGLTPTEWEPHRLTYMREVQRHAAEFIVRVTTEQGRTAFCDSSPRNLLILANLVEQFPDALFVLTIRHYSGVIQSLLRLGTISLLPGNEPSARWFDPTAVAAAVIWSRHYQAALHLPRERTVVFGYDRFCADPQPVLARLKADLTRADFPTGELDDDVFATSHATVAGRPRPTVGHAGTARTRLTTVPSYDPADWSPAIERDVEPVVGLTDQLLLSLYPDHYGEPAGYPGAEVLLEAARAALASSSPSDEEVSQGAPEAVSRPAPAASRAQAPPKSQNQVPGSGRSARGRPAKGS